METYLLQQLVNIIHSVLQAFYISTNIHEHSDVDLEIYRSRL